jgi:hypothetical protein
VCVCGACIAASERELFHSSFRSDFRLSISSARMSFSESVGVVCAALHVHTLQGEDGAGRDKAREREEIKIKE